MALPSQSLSNSLLGSTLIPTKSALSTGLAGETAGSGFAELLKGGRGAGVQKDRSSDTDLPQYGSELPNSYANAPENSAAAKDLEVESGRETESGSQVRSQRDRDADSSPEDESNRVQAAAESQDSGGEQQAVDAQQVQASDEQGQAQSAEGPSGVRSQIEDLTESETLPELTAEVAVSPQAGAPLGDAQGASPDATEAPGNAAEQLQTALQHAAPQGVENGRAFSSQSGEVLTDADSLQPAAPNASAPLRGEPRPVESRTELPETALDRHSSDRALAQTAERGLNPLAQPGSSGLSGGGLDQLAPEAARQGMVADAGMDGLVNPVQASTRALAESVTARPEGAVLVDHSVPRAGANGSAAVLAEQANSANLLQTEAVRQQSAASDRASAALLAGAATATEAPADARVATPLSVATGVAGQTAAPVSTPLQSAISQAMNRMQQPAWGEQLGKRAVMMAQHGPRTAFVKLDPPELGALQIRVHLQAGDQVSLQITAPNAQVRDVLEQQLPRLREMFADQGLNLAQSDLRDQSSREQATREDTPRGRGDYGFGEDEALPVSEQIVPVGLVDHFV